MSTPTREQVEALCALSVQYALAADTGEAIAITDLVIALRALLADNERQAAALRGANVRTEEIRDTLAEVVTGEWDTPTMAVLAVAEVKRLREDKARLADELRNIADARWRTWDDGMNTPEDFASWAQSRARAAIDAARREGGA